MEKLEKAIELNQTINDKIENLDNYFDEIEKPIDNDKSQAMIDKINQGFESKRVQTLNWLDKLYKPIKAVYDFKYLTVGFFVDQVLKIYKPLRYITVPLNKIWLKQYLKDFRKDEYQHDLLDKPGVHFITAGMGGGKSSLAFAKMKDNALLTGKAAYVTTKMEKPKQSRLGYHYVYHRFFELDEFWDNGKQKKKLNFFRFNMIVFDEIFLYMNHRKNKEKSYNETFIPMVNSNVSMRHDGIKTILYLSQQPSMDVQIMNICNYYHEIVGIERGIHYRTWLETGDEKYSYTILRWRIKSYLRTTSESGSKVNIPLGEWVKENNRDYLRDFQSLNLQNRNSDLEMDSKFYNSEWLNKMKRGSK